MEKTKKEIVIIGLILLMVLALIGVSYAAFRFMGEGQRVNTITTGSITMTYTESDNTISLNGALPTTDKTGKTRLNDGEYFDFTVSSKISGDVNINYEISAKDVTSSDGKKIDGSNIKLYLTKLNGDKEEALMVPETYNEENTANDYTGRPSGEMSLYTSSMSSSESNNYRLRMYVSDDYNPQGDGGNLQFSVQINVYGLAGDKYVPLTTREILEDNELQVEKKNMFNYASNGTQYDPNDRDDQMTDPNPEYITNGLYSTEDEDGTSYYYRGNVDNNNVQFGEYTSDYYVYKGNNNSYYQGEVSCKEDSNSTCTKVKLASQGDKMYWKIVRVNGDGSLRLIYNGTSVNPDNSDLAHSYAVGQTKYNLNKDDPKYAGYTYDRDINETDSFIKREVDTWYKNTLGSSSYDNKVNSGRFCSDSSGYSEEEILILGNVFASFDRLASPGYSELFRVERQEDVTPTLKCPNTTESYGGSYRLKSGLITADELTLAGNTMGLSVDNYLKTGESDYHYWSMTPFSFSGSFKGAGVSLFGKQFDSNGVNLYYFFSPVINVTTDNGFTSGDGTADSPYVIS